MNQAIRPTRRAVFLDRDGTINREVDYLSDPRDFEFLPGAIDALRDLQAAGFALVIVTNQSGIARGLFNEDTLHRIHLRMTDELRAAGVEIDWIGYCPHHPSLGEAGLGGPSLQADCSCRKPKPGLLLLAAAELGIDLERSFCVGDSLRDLKAGEELNVPGILLRTGKGRAQELIAKKLATGIAGEEVHVVDDLGAAARYILGL